MSVSSDGEHFISGDEVSINLWNISEDMVSYNLINITPPKIDDLLEVLTHCEFHPSDPSLFLYTSSKGYFAVCDLRAPSSSHTKYECLDAEGSFSEIICSVTDAKFMKGDHNYHKVVSRDYLFLRTWDIRYPN